MIPSKSVSCSLRSRVSIFPRTSTMSRAGRTWRSCAFRRGLVVPILACSGSCAKVIPARVTSTSRASSRAGMAAMWRPSGSSVGKSLRLCTARSICLFSSAVSISLVKTPLPNPSSERFWIASPVVLIILRDTATSGKCAFSCCWTNCACQSASWLPRVPIVSDRFILLIPSILLNPAHPANLVNPACHLTRTVLARRGHIARGLPRHRSRLAADF